jgi:hypothetical protein
MDSISKSIKLPKRSTRFGVGKEIGGAVYVHRLYQHVLPEAFEKAKKALPSDFEYSVVKYHLSTDAVSFIQSEDFDTAPEPTVGDVCTIRCDGTFTFRRKLADPWIYHHKWLFVQDDYSRFDAADSKRRSIKWLSLPNIDFRRIGKQSFWLEQVVPRIEH